MKWEVYPHKQSTFKIVSYATEFLYIIGFKQTHVSPNGKIMLYCIALL